jgi:hypothetical protein
MTTATAFIERAKAEADAARTKELIEARASALLGRLHNERNTLEGGLALPENPPPCTILPDSNRQIEGWEQTVRVADWIQRNGPKGIAETFAVGAWLQRRVDLAGWRRLRERMAVRLPEVVAEVARVESERDAALAAVDAGAETPTRRRG